MKTIGAKVENSFFEKCELVREQEGLSRSDYVRKALEAYNILHYFKRLTDAGMPVLFGGEPDDTRQKEPSPTHDTPRKDGKLREKLEEGWEANEPWYTK